MHYKIMDHIPNGIIVSNIKNSEIIYINEFAKNILKINNFHNITNMNQLITDTEDFENLKQKIIKGNKIYGKYEDTLYLRTLDKAFVEINFCSVFEDEKKGIINYIFKNANFIKKYAKNDYNLANINAIVLAEVMNLLYETNDLTKSIVSILKYIGNIYNIDKCYIFSITDNENIYGDVYKWYKNDKYKNTMSYIEKEDIINILNKSNSDGIFYTNNIEEINNTKIIKILQEEDTKSIFLLESLKLKNESIILGLEDCNTKREWLPDEIKTILYVGKLIFTAINNFNNIKKLTSKNSNNKLLDEGKIADIISNFYDEPDHNISTVAIVINIVHLFNITKATSIIYNDNIKKYFKSFDYTSDGKFGDYSIELDKYYKECINTLNHKIDENVFDFLSLFDGQKYIYTENYSAIKDELMITGFDVLDEDNIKELYIFAVKQESFFGYIAFERYSETKLTESEINMLLALCNILNSDIEKHDLIKKYEDDALMKDIILKNENIPIAVIEKSTFKILYHNDLYYNISPQIQVGKICYELEGNSKKCRECCIDKDVLINDANHDDHQWIKKAFPFTLNNGMEAYMIYLKDSIDYVNQVNAVDTLTQSMLIRGFEEFYKNFVKNNNYTYALCTIDIDKFKYINDMFGYKKGDEILRKIAKVLQNFTVAGENFCRMNDDKFSVFIHYTSKNDLNSRVKDLSSKFNYMKENYFKDIKITIMGGITLIDRNLDLNILLDQSTTARKSAKGSHMNNFAYYNAEIDSKIKKEMQLEERIPHAIRNKEFVAYLQPKFDLNTKKISGAEALVRWITPEGMIYPDQFIPLFEQNGFILNLDFIIYEQVMAYIRQCLDNNLQVYPISVNVSRNHIKDKNFMPKFQNLIKKYNIPLKYLELEITESVFVEDKKELLDFIDKIKGSLLKVSIDDFGTAYSSLQSLTDMDVDVLKIDKGFLDNIDTSKNIITKDEVLIKNIINLAKELDFNVICEGIETDKQVELLKKVGCEYGQGYIFAKPMPIENYNSAYIDL